MISDVLSDAVSEIEQYQKQMPDVYDQIRDEIDEVKSVMTALRAKLDMPPTLKPGVEISGNPANN